MKDDNEFRVIRLRELPLSIPCCDCPERIYEHWMANIVTAGWCNLECECLCAIHLNTRRRATGFHLVAMGTMDSVLSSPREVFRTAIIRSAAAIVNLRSSGQNGTSTTIIGPPTSGTHVLDEFWRDAQARILRRASRSLRSGLLARIHASVGVCGFAVVKSL